MISNLLPKSVLFIMCLFLSLNLYGQSTTWLGVDTAWNNSSNWSNGIPDGTKTVIIPSTINDPVSDTNLVIASGDSLIVAAGARLIFEGTCLPSRALQISGYGSNRGVIEVNRWSSFAIRLQDSATFMNHENAQILIDSARGGFEIAFPSTLDNYGHISITDTDFQGVQNANICRNFGSLSMDNINFECILNYYLNSRFENHGLLNLDDCGVTAIANGGFQDTFINYQCAIIDIASNDIIDDDNNTFYNRGAIIERSTGTSNVYENTGIIYNLAFGTFNVTNGNAPLTAVPDTFYWTGGVDTCWSKGCNWSSGLVPDINKNIFIPDTTNDPTAKEVRVELNTGKILSIDSGAVLTIEGNNNTIDGIKSSGPCHNKGKLIVRGITEDGIEIQNDTFHNYLSGNIEIDGVGYGTYTTNGGTFWNEGVVKINGTDNYGVDNPGTWINDGYLTIKHTWSSAIYDNGLFINRAVVEIDSGLVEGIEIDDGRFENWGKININGTGALSILSNSIDSLINHPCALIYSMSTQNIRDESGTIINYGSMVENSSDSSNIGLNTGYVENLNGGVFEIASNSGVNTTNSQVDPRLVVTNSNDDGVGSLRYMIEKCAEECDTISFDSSLIYSPILLTSGQLDINRCLTIMGNPEEKTIVSGQMDSFSRIIQVDSNVMVNLNDLRIFKGGSINYNNSGAGILNHGYLTLNNCILSHNIAGLNGGGIFNSDKGKLMSLNSEFKYNIGNDGSALYNEGIASMTQNRIFRNECSSLAILYNENKLSLINSTIALNKTGGELGYHESGSFFHLFNNAIAFNNTGEPIDNGSATVFRSNNYEGDQPMFVDTFANNFSMLPCSPLIDIGLNDSVPAGLQKDFYGLPRIMNDTVDAGAIEYQKDDDGRYKLHVRLFGGGNGSSWFSPLGSVYKALQIAKSCPVDTVLITLGTFQMPVVDKDSTYCITDSMTILGGYALDGSHRFPDTLETILSGDFITLPGQVYRTVTIPANVTYSKIDGVTIAYGSALGISDDKGSGVFCEGNAIFNKVRFMNNTSFEGGAIFLGSQSKTIFEWCHILMNPSVDGTAFSHELGADVYIGKGTVIE